MTQRNTAYPRAHALNGMLARLLSEDWQEMTEAANSSPRHVKSLDRWVAKAREANPNLSDEQAERLGRMMRTDHYRRMGRLSAQARKLARDAQAELDRGGDDGVALHMGWVRLDDAYYDHPKLCAAGAVAELMWIRSIAWSNRNLTDGFIPDTVVARLVNYHDVHWRVWDGELTGGCETVEPAEVAEVLVKCELWERVDVEPEVLLCRCGERSPELRCNCAGSSREMHGYRIHDYLDYQPSAAQVRGDRDKAKERVAKARAAKKGAEQP